jgi:hypothetical protein
LVSLFSYIFEAGFTKSKYFLALYSAQQIRKTYSEVVNPIISDVDKRNLTKTC